MLAAKVKMMSDTGYRASDKMSMGVGGGLRYKKFTRENHNKLHLRTNELIII